MPIPVLDKFTGQNLPCRELLSFYEELLIGNKPLLSLERIGESDKSWKTDLIIKSKRRVLENQQEEIRRLKNQIFEVNSQIVNAKTVELLKPESKPRPKGELSFCKGGGLSLRSKEATVRTEDGEKDAGEFNVMQLQNNLSVYEDVEPEGQKKQMKDDLNIILEMNSIIYNTIQSIDKLDSINNKDDLMNLQKKNRLLIEALRAKQI